MLKIFKNQPKALYLLSFLEISDRFTFYGIQSILILYLIKNLKDSDPRSYIIFGIFIALSFIVPIVGGMIADKFLGYKRAVFSGLVVSFLAMLMLLVGAEVSALPLGFLPNKSYFLYSGLAILVCGIGLFKASNLTLVGQLYERPGALRDNGFLICYTAMNIGAILGSITYGFITVKYGYKNALVVSLIVYLFSIVLYRLAANSIKIQSTHSVQPIKYSRVILGIVIAAIVLGSLFIVTQVFNLLLIAVSCLVIALIVMAIASFPLYRKKIMVLTSLIFFAVFFFILHMQTGGSLMIYVSSFVNTQVGSFFIPPQVLLSLQGIIIILLAPVLARVWLNLNKSKNRSSVNRVLWGLGFSVASFLIYSLSAYLPNDGTMSLRFLGVILGYLLLALGDICISPMITSAVSYLAPSSRQGTFMGIWYFSNGLGAYMASLVAKHAIVPTSTDVYDFSHGFFIITGIGAIAVILLLFVSPLLRRWEQ